MTGLRWEAHIAAEAHTIAQRRPDEAFPVELECAPNIYVTKIDDPRVLAGAAFELDGRTFKLGPMRDHDEGGRRSTMPKGRGSR